MSDSTRFIGRCAITGADGTPLGEGGYVALLLTGPERLPGIYLATALTLDALLAKLIASDFATKFADRPLELDQAPKPFFDHGPHRIAHASILDFRERDRVLTSLSGRTT